MYVADGGVAMAMMPTRFLWPHGGRHVYLCGSFTRWQETIPMSPVDGAPSTFSAVLTLPPGYHQYKFIVDGEWRYDEGQAQAPDPLGNLNNWLLVRDSDSMLAATTSVLVPGGSMDVDHMEVSQHGLLQESSAGVPQPQPQVAVGPQQQEQVSRAIMADAAEAVSAADAEASRQRIADFLQRHMAYELLPESGKVVALDVALPVKQAFHALYEQGVPAAPLWDSERHEFVGMLTASDFIHIIRQLRSSGAALSEEELETHSIAAWKEGKSVGTPGRAHAGLLSVGPDDTLRRVAEIALRHSVSTLPVLHHGPPPGSPPQLLHLASLAGLLKCIARHFRHVAGSLPLLSQPLGALPLGTWAPLSGKQGQRKLVTVRAHTLLTTALDLLLSEGVSSLPVVDENLALVDVYARSDITALARERAYARLQLDELTVTQALQHRHDAVPGPSSSLAPGIGSRCHMCLRSDTLRTVLERLALPGVRRLICVEAGSRRVEGIISITDIFQFLLA